MADPGASLEVPVRRRASGLTLVLAAIAASWALAVVAELTGSGDELHHGQLAEGRLSLVASALVFLVAWQAMTASMMFPSSLPLVRLFFSVASPQPRAARAKAAFVGGYVAVWSAFGALAFVGDVALHRVVHASPWLGSRPWLIAGLTLMLAGAFQFSDMKQQCLSRCRHPAAFLIPRYRRGAAAAFRLGREHGLFCLGCCWALMLVGVAAGLANLWWMAALAAVMVVEKATRFGDRIVAPVGVALLALGALVFVHPAWLPLQPWAA